MRRARWLITLAGLAFALLPATVAAHPYLVSARPPSGQSAAAAPAHIVLSFAEALDPLGATTELVGDDGHPTPWPSTVSGDTLELGPPPLPAGSWTVRWAVTGADGDRQAGDYRFTVAPPSLAAPVPPLTGAQPGGVERGGRILLLLLGLPLTGLLLLGAVLLPSEPRLRPVAGRRLATTRTVLWALELLSLCGCAAGLIAAGGTGVLMIAPAGPPILVGLGVTAALSVAVFDGGALSAGERASRPTLVLGATLGLTLLAALVGLAEAPGGAGALLLGTLALTAVAAAVGAAVASAAGGEPGGWLVGRRRALERRQPEAAVAPRALSLAGAVIPRTSRTTAAIAAAPDPPPPPARQPHPLPAGTPVHRRLSGHFVDLPRLLETLEWSAFTGYVRVDDGALGGVLVLVAGEVSAAALAGEEPATGAEAVRLLAGEVARGEAMLDVVSLDTETARAIVDLLCAPPLFTGLRARMVDLDGVLADLSERGRDGTVVVSAPGDTGVILVRGGGVHGAYTRSAPQLDDAPQAVIALAEDAAALVEVRVAAAEPARPSHGDGAGPPAVRTAEPLQREPLWDRYDQMQQAAGLD